MGEKENEDKKTETYLKISNLYYRIADYDHTIESVFHQKMAKKRMNKKKKVMKKIIN